MNSDAPFKRRTPRRVFEHRVGMLHHGEYQVVESKQISEGGMMVQTDQPLLPQEQTVITVLLPGGGYAVVRAEVLYEIASKTGGASSFGFRFLNMPFQTRRLIRNYVAAKTQAEAEVEREWG